MERIERVSDAGARDRGDRVADRLAAVRARIERACAQAGRRPSDITILAVTKGFGSEAIQAALDASIADIGENYFQEAQAKFAGVAWPSSPVRRHFIGSIQRNKARRIAGLFDMVQTVDRADIAEALDAGAENAGKVLDVLVQLNVSADDRNGVKPGECAQLVAAIERLKHLRLRGVMAIGPLDPSAVAPAFAGAGKIFDDLAARTPGVDTLSLGMSEDIEEAIAAGSTLLRLGTALFGPRPVKG